MLKCSSRLRLLALVFCLLPLLLRADSSDPEMDAANRAYTYGSYDEAAQLFQQIIARRGYSAPLCYNLANAEARAGHTGQAILNYERARYLAPGDADIDHNLQLARKQAGLEPNSSRWWQVVLRSLTLDQWIAIVDGWLALIALAVLAHAFAPVLAAWFRIAPSAVKKMVKGTLFVCIPAFLFFGYAALLAIGVIQRVEAEGVVVARESTLRLSPFESAERTGALPEGELVTVEQRHNDYLWIEGRDHHSGWVQEKELEPIIPGSFDAKPPN